MFSVAVGHSEDVDSLDAIDEALDQCAQRLAGQTPRAGLLFSAIDYEHQAVLDRIAERHPGLALVGCTTDGEVSSVMGFAEDSLTLMLIASDTVDVHVGVGHGVRADAAQAARDAVAHARSEADGDARPALCIALPEGMGIDTEAFLDGLSSALGAGVPICGGMSADQLRFEGTFQFFRDEVLTDAVPVMLLSGPLHVGYAVATGWRPLGERHRVTAAEGNRVIEIDGKPAAHLYTRYFEEHSIHYPLAVYSDGSDDFFLSTPQSFDDGAIVCQNVVPLGAEVQIAEASRDDIIDGASASTRQALAHYPAAAPAAGLVFSCAGRRAHLGTRTGEEYGHMSALVGADTPTCGFYTYGELCPLPGLTASQSHNCGFVTVLLGER